MFGPHDTSWLLSEAIEISARLPTPWVPLRRRPRPCADLNDAFLAIHHLRHLGLDVYCWQYHTPALVGTQTKSVFSSRSLSKRVSPHLLTNDDAPRCSGSSTIWRAIDFRTSLVVGFASIINLYLVLGLLSVTLGIMPPPHSHLLERSPNSRFGLLCLVRL
jgi:hypothetical protein